MDAVLDTIATMVLNPETKERPRVCLTWAQSLDGRLAINTGDKTVISDGQSMQMTHAMRALHQSILVGVGTLISDNPRLTCRISDDTRNVMDSICSAVANDFRRSCLFSSDPIPIILDSNLRTPPQARCFESRSQRPSMRPLIFHQLDSKLGVKINTLSRVAEVLPVPLAENQQASPYLDLRAALTEVQNREIQNIMVEGGASVISSFLDSGLWDIAVVTISGQLFRKGVSLQSSDTNGISSLTKFRSPKWFQVGADMVFVGFPS